MLLYLVSNLKTFLFCPLLKDHTIHFACLSLIYSVFIHVTLLTIISKAYYWNSELTMFFLPSRPPLVSVHSLLKSTC
ncbi:hypothetical protein LDENG_00227080 [Lucifuga dentata]|nr:hypothetical protein LDENG_00227080 [Lucifuga dentata]